MSFKIEYSWGTFTKQTFFVINAWIIEKIPKNKWTPLLADLKTQLVKEASKTSLSKLGISSEAIPDLSIQHHLRALNDIFGKVWTKPSTKDVNKRRISSDYNKKILK